uniref:Uncharacterized protein n=1 Tax=Rhizophora mucronata TaxID=61149 RepID=A0A2P2KG26_RHIMU
MERNCIQLRIRKLRESTLKRANRSCRSG